MKKIFQIKKIFFLKKKAFSLVEALLAVSVFAMVVTALVGVWIYGEESTALSGKRFRAAQLAEEGIEATRNIRDAAFSNLTDGTYGLSTSGNQWSFSGSQDTNGIFTRSVNVSTINSSTKKITSSVNWTQNTQRNGSISVDSYLTNWMAPTASGGTSMLAYGEGTVATPRYRTWDGSAFSGENSSQTAAATIRNVVIKASPTGNELLMGVQATNNNLYIQRWNGSTWSNEWSVALADNVMQRFDIAYEQNSGQAIVVYSKNAATTNEMAYRFWNGTIWSGENNYDAVRTTGIVDAIQLEPQPASDNIALAWGDRNFDLSANFWDGANNVWKTEPSALLEGNLARITGGTAIVTWPFDLAFESISGELLIVWGVDSLLDARYATRTAGASGSWSGVTTSTSFFEEGTDMELSSDPNSNYIAYANATDNGGDADAAIWNGSAWGPFSNFDTAIDSVTSGTNNVAVNWVSSGGQDRAVVTYDDANAAGIDWLFYNKNTNTWSALQADYNVAPSPVGVDDKLHRLRTNPLNKAEMILVVVDNAADLFVKKLVFNGSTFTWSGVEGGSALETSISAIIGFAADFAFKKQ